MTSTSGELAENLAQVRGRIELAASRSGRHPEEITLIAVSKTHSARRIQQMYDAGVRHFGENRVQERESKLSQLAVLDATWHMIGHMQKNKAGRAVRLFDSVDSVDSAALAEKLNRGVEEFYAEGTEDRPAHANSAHSATGKRLRILIEVKLDPEPAKSGAEGEALPRLVEAIMRLPSLELHGVMGIPPYFDDPKETRPYFRRLRELRDSVREQLGAGILPVLSMGMSHDFEIAIEEGATEVRIGAALFGMRERA